MPINNYIIFETSIPDDTVYAEDTGEPIVPGGKKVMQAIGQLLLEYGLANVSKPTQRSHYGWEFFVRLGRIDVQFVINAIEPHILFLVPHGGVLFHRRERREAHRAAVETARKVIETDPRFTFLDWVTGSDVNARSECLAGQEQLDAVPSLGQAVPDEHNWTARTASSHTENDDNGPEA